MGAALVAFRRNKDLKKKEYINRKGLPRVLTSIDLIFLGVGGTLGAGVYVLPGEIARKYAGPGAIFSFLLAAIASSLCALCYAEFGTRIPKAGSAYIYTYATQGEFAGFIVGWNLILQYLVGSAAVTRAWSSYLDSLTNNTISNGIKTLIAEWKTPGISPYPDFFSFLMCLLLMMLLVVGVQISSWVNMGLTSLNAVIVVFILLFGILLMRPTNWRPFLPLGFTGVLSGTGSAILGFVGFDVIATAAEEVKDPSKSVPLSILVTLGVAFVSYSGIALVQTLLAPWSEMKDSGVLVEAFHHRGAGWMKYIIAVGAVPGLLASALSNMLSAPRIIYSMADDGLLFILFANINKTSNTPIYATLIVGTIASIISLLFDLSNLLEMMTFATLQAYIMVAANVLLIRYKVQPVGILHKSTGYEPLSNESIVNEKEKIQMSPTKRSSMLVTTSTSVILFGSFGLAYVLVEYGLDILHGFFWPIVFFFTLFGLIAIAVTIIYLQPQNRFEVPFQTPFVPFLPVLSIMINAVLLMSLSLLTWIRCSIWIAIGLIIYLFYGVQHSKEVDKKRKQIRQSTTSLNK